jgi:hypothetical protein
MLILHTELLADLNETTKAINVVWVLSMNIFVDFKGFIEKVHAAVA